MSNKYLFIGFYILFICLIALGFVQFITEIGSPNKKLNSYKLGISILNILVGFVGAVAFMY